MAGSILLNRVYVNTTTVGAGTLTLGTVKSAAFCTVAEAGGTNGQTFTYIIEEGNDFEIVQGVYGSAGPTLTRATVLISKIAGTVGTTKMTLAGAATVRIIAAKEDLTDASLLQSGTISQARLGSGSGGAGLKALYDDQTYKTVTTNGLISVVNYASTQTITIPTGATRAKVTLWGGTGGSAGSANGGNGGAGGGGAGGLIKYLTGITAGKTLSFTAGAAGAAGATNGNGGAGGNSILATGPAGNPETITTLTASGGGAGLTGGAGGAGGTGTNGDRNVTGQPGWDTQGTTVVTCPGGMTAFGMSVGGKGPSNAGSTVGVAGIIGGCIIEWYS